MFAIDPTTFARAAYWDASLASSSLDEILEQLAVPPTDGRVPALVVGIDVPAVAEAGIVTVGTTGFEIAAIADADEVQAFPGMRRGSPAMFLAASALEDLGISTPFREIRIRGDRAEILTTLDETRTSYEETTTATGVVDSVSFLTVAQTFGFMRSLAVACALLVTGGVAVYFDARRRAGCSVMRSPAAWGSRGDSTDERSWPRCWRGWASAVGWGWSSPWSVPGWRCERIDPLPLVRPDPLLRPATGLLLGLGLAALVVAWVAAAIAQWVTDRDDPVEVLRGGT